MGPIIQVAISPCPNDVFIFYALIRQKIPTYGIHFEFTFLDIQELNECVDAAKYDLIKVSYSKALKTFSPYSLLKSGGAMGIGVGPVLVSKDGNFNPLKDKVGLPGKDTTANFLFKHRFPNANNLEYCRFDMIAPSVINGSIDAGVIIHEGRFTYMEQGLRLALDLGAYWEESTNCPIPLGAILLKENEHISPPLMDNLIKNSIQYAYSNRGEVLDFCKLYAAELSDEVIEQHINLYVNAFTEDYGEVGLKAIQKLKELL